MAEEVKFLCYWQQLGNKWVEIAKLMERSENWVKNHWKRIVKFQRIPIDDKIKEKIALLMQKLTNELENSCSMVDEEMNEISIDNFATARDEIKAILHKEWFAFNSAEDKLGNQMELILPLTKSKSGEIKQFSSGGIESSMKINSINKFGSGMGSNYL